MGVWENDCSFETGVLSVILANFTHDWRLVILEPYPQRKYLYYVNFIKSHFFKIHRIHGGMCKWLFLWHWRPQCKMCNLHWLTLNSTGTIPTAELSIYHNNHTSRYTDSMGVGGNDCSFDTGISSVIWSLYTTDD